MATLEENFQKLKEQVLIKKPVLKEIMEKRGSRKLFDYAHEYISVNVNPPIQSRQDEFLGTFRQEVALRLGDEVAESAVKQLSKYFYVSTADHHGPICHPFFLTSNLLAAAPFFEYGDPLLQNVIVLSNANVSLNNSSFPRGLIFNTVHEGKLQLHQLSFFAAQYRPCPVFDFPAYGEAEINKVKKQLQEKVSSKQIAGVEGEKVAGILDEIYLRPDVLNCKYYSDQITITNFHLWKKFFESSKVKNPPNLIYLEQEGLVIRLLIDHHLDKEKDTTITHMLFDEAYEPLIQTYFDGITGAFSTKEKWGTYFFWALPKGAKYRIQLWRKGNKLVSDDGSYEVELTPEALRTALEKHELIPSMMLAYILLSFYYGIKCLGGFSQVNYLTFMKNAYIKMQADRGNYKSIEVCTRVQTKEMGGDFTLVFLEGANGELIPATGLDLILYGHEKTWSILLEESKEISLEEAINPLFPEFYRIVYPDSQREPDLMTVTAEDITKLIHLDQKIHPVVSLKKG